MLFMFFTLSLFSLMISFIILTLGYLISMGGEFNKDKMSPFECGFNPNVSYRMLFSLQFFLISLIFLVFDLELVILFPFLSVNSVSAFLEIYLGCIMFILVLGLGLIYEWMVKSLEWCD